MKDPLLSLTANERRMLKALKSPQRIQDFLNALPMNFEPEGDTCRSPRSVLKEGRAHCMEGAMLAAVALRLQGEKPLVVDLKSVPKDFDHVITVFRKHHCWGALSKTNHGVLRYREPIYTSIRELAMSYFHEYFLDDGRKTLRSFSRPVDLSRFDSQGWMTSEDDVWYIPEYLDDALHRQILTPAQRRGLRPADQIEREMGRHIEWQQNSP